MKGFNLLFPMEFFLGCLTVAVSNWLQSRAINKVLESHLPPPWTIHSWAAIVAGLLGIIIAVAIAFVFAEKRRMRNVIIGLLAFFAGAVICAMFIPVRG